MDHTCLFFGVIFIIAGLWLAFGKGYKHISAWKSMTQEEKDKINIELLSRNAGEVIALSGIIFTLKGVLPDFSGRWFAAAMIAWFIIAGLDVWHISKSSRYIKK